MTRRRTIAEARGPAPVSSWKRTILATALVGVALWPFAHRVLVARFDVSPWKLGGWAMYAAPTAPVLTAVFRPVPGGWRLVSRTRLRGPTLEAFERFERGRYALGDLLRPDPLAPLVFADQPDLTAISIVVERMRLDPTTARMTSRKRRYDYERSRPDARR